MANRVEIIVGSDVIRRRLTSIRSGIFSKMMMKEIGEFLRTKIKVRIQAGKDINGRSFKPYSTRYKIFREKHGRSTNFVNLTFTGSMLSAMDYTATDDSVRLFFQNTTDKKGVRNPIKAFGLQQDRDFFGISSQDRAGIMEIIRRYLRRALSG